MSLFVTSAPKPSPAWLALFGVSLIPYIAIPLSGFTIELSNGYTSMASDGPAYVVGRDKNISRPKSRRCLHLILESLAISWAVYFVWKIGLLRSS
jgi:hypothetical protein